MASRTARFSFNKFGGGLPGSLTDDGGKFTAADRDVLDRLLSAFETHAHQGGARLGDPSETPVLSLDSTAGELPAGTTFFYRVSFIDQFGLETAASPEISITTPSPIAAPGAPSMTANVVTGGVDPGVNPGITYYALTSITGTDETALGDPGVITVYSTDRQVTLTLPDVPTGVTNFGVWRKGQNEGGYTNIGTITAVAGGTFVDQGATPPSPNPLDPSIAPPTINLTHSTNTITITVPNASIVGADPSNVRRWRIYRSRTSGVYSGASLIAEVVDTVNSDGTGGLVTDYADDGSITPSSGTPLVRSQTLLPSVAQAFVSETDVTALPDPTNLPDGMTSVLLMSDAFVASSGYSDVAEVFVVREGLWVPTGGSAFIFDGYSTPPADPATLWTGCLAVCIDTSGNYKLFIVGTDTAWHAVGPITVNYRGLWSSGTAYKLGDMVTGSDSELYLLHVAGPLTGTDPTTDAGASWTAQPGGAGSGSAASITYDHTTSGLTATDVQAAVDELKTDIDAKASTASVYNITAATKTANYTAVPGDAGKVIEMNVAGANTLSIDTHANQPFNVGDTFEVLQYGAGQTTITALSGVTIHSPSAHIKIAVQYGTCTLRYRGSDEWMLEGDLSA